MNGVSAPEIAIIVVVVALVLGGWALIVGLAWFVGFRKR